MWTIWSIWARPISGQAHNTVPGPFRGRANKGPGPMRVLWGGKNEVIVIIGFLSGSSLYVRMRQRGNLWNSGRGYKMQRAEIPRSVVASWPRA